MPEQQLDSIDQRFLYRGPTSGVTLKIQGNPDREVMLHDGREYSLPADHRHIRRLVAQGFLTAIEAPAAVAAEPSPTPTRSKAPKTAPSTENA